VAAPILYVSDLDGTLLGTNGFLSELSKQRLNLLLANEVPFTVASARSLISIKERLGDLPFALPIIEFNGAYVSDYQTGEKLITHQIDSDSSTEIQKIMVEEGVVHFVSSYDGQEDHVYYGKKRNDGMDYYLKERVDAGDPRLRFTDHWSEIRDEDVVCFTAIGDEQAMNFLSEKLTAQFGEELVMHLWDDGYAVGWYWLMVHHVNACKGKAITRLKERVNMSEHGLTVFGDQVNDLGMMAVADRKIAVSNACEAVLGIADLILEAHHLDSVTKFIIEDWQSALSMME
jgi:hypothetical protein